MENVEQEMQAIRAKKTPTAAEMQKYVRYLINAKKQSSENVRQELYSWDKEKVDKAIKEVERENSKPRPKRYFVSLKEPLEDGVLR